MTKKPGQFLVALGVLLLFSKVSSGQSHTTANSLPEAVYKHYTNNELQEIQAEDPRKIKLINYVYSDSFTWTAVGSKGKTQPSDFDIAPYENQRKENEPVTLDMVKEGNGYRLTLKSRNEMISDMNKIK